MQICEVIYLYFICFLLFITSKVTFDSIKMVNLLMDVGAQTTREMYEMATQNGARKIAKRMASKLGIPEQHDSSHKQIMRQYHEADRNLNGAQNRFHYDISADAKVW